MDRPEKTVTELWIERLKAEREAAIAEGRYFDGEERDNVVSFAKRKEQDDDPWDYAPSECNF